MNIVALYVNPESIIWYIGVPMTLIVEAIVYRSTRAVVSFLEPDVSGASEAARVEFSQPSTNCEPDDVAFETVADGLVGVAVRDRADPLAVIHNLRPRACHTGGNYAAGSLFCRSSGRV